MLSLARSASVRVSGNTNTIVSDTNTCTNTMTSDSYTSISDTTTCISITSDGVTSITSD